MTAKEIYESLDLTQLPDAFVAKVKKVEQATKGFTIQSDKVDAFMKGAYDKIKKDKPTALKNLKVEEKVVKKEIKTAKATKIVEDLEYKIRGKKSVTKKTPTPSAPKRKENTNAEAKRTKKKGETFKDAVARVKKEREAAAKEAEKVVSKTAQALKNLEDLLANDPKLAGYPRTYGKQSKNIDASKDSKIKARPAGKRVSKKGHKNQYGPSKGGRVYWENRDNRSDRFAPDFPDKIYLEMGGETDDLGFPTGHTYLVIEVSPSGDKKLIKSTKDYMTALMSSAVARGMKSSKDARVVIVDKEDKKVIHESFEAGGEIVITPTSLINNPDYLVGTTTMTELFECGGVTAYQEGGEVFVTPSSLLNAGSADYVAGSNTMSNMFEDGGEILEDIIVATKNFSVANVFEQMRLSYNFEGTNEDGADEYIVYEVSQDDIDKIKTWPVQWRYAYAKGGFIAMYNGKKAEIEADTLLEAKKKAIEKLNVPKSKQGFLSVVPNEFMANEDFRFMAKGGMVNLYYGGEQEDETLPASSEKDAANIAMRNGAEHYEFVSRMAKGGSVLNQTMDENKALYERVVNGFIEYGHFDDDFKGSRFENNPKDAVKKFISRIESFSKTQDKTNAAKYFLYVLDDTYVRNDLFRAFLKSEKDFKKELETANDSAQAVWKWRTGENFAKGGSLKRFEDGGSVLNQTMDENKAYYERVLNSFIENGHFDDDFKGSRFKNNHKEAISKFLSSMESYSKTQDKSNASKYFLLVLDDTYVRNDLFRAFLESEKELKKRQLLLPSKFAKGGSLKRFNHKIGDLHDDLEDAKMSIDETQEFLQDIYGKDITYQDRLKYQYAKGGRLGFDGLAKKVAKRYEGKPVKSKYQKEYGKTYSKEEAIEVGRKVAAKVYGQQQANMKKMAKGGEVDGKLNLKVKDYLDAYLKGEKVNSPEYQEALMLILKGALRDANYHSEARQVHNYFPKAGNVYIDTQMEDVIEDKGVDIAKMAKWDGHKIIDAFAYYTNLRIGGGFGNRLMSLKESSMAKGGMTKGQTIAENFNLQDKVQNVEFWNNDVVVTGKDGKIARIDLDEGTRTQLNAKGGWIVYADNQTTGKELLGTFPSKRFAEKYKKEVELQMLDNIGVAGYGNPKADSVGMMSKAMWDKKEAPYLMAKGGSLDFEVSEKMAEMAFGSEAYNAILMGLQQSIKGGRALSSVQAKKLADEFASMAVAEKKAKYSDFNSFPVSFAKGGSLESHGLKDGDVIVNTSDEFIKVLDKDGVPFFVNLSDGYRGKEKSLPFAEGGKLKSVNIPEIAKKFGKSTSEVFEQIQIGEKHEMEHTKDPKKARKIALDHLSDDMDYYKKLKKLGL